MLPPTDVFGVALAGMIENLTLMAQTVLHDVSSNDTVRPQATCCAVVARMA